jgi:hypothetical protein
MVDRGGVAASTVARLPERGVQALWLIASCREGRRRERGMGAAGGALTRDEAAG